MNGFVSRYLLDGPEEDTRVKIEFHGAEIVSVVAEDGRELSPSVVSQRDYDLAISKLIDTQL